MESVEKLQQIRIMEQYLVDFDQAFDIDREMQQRANVLDFMQGKEHLKQQPKKEIKDVKVWSDIVGTVEKKQWLSAQGVHLDKLN